MLQSKKTIKVPRFCTGWTNVKKKSKLSWLHLKAEKDAAIQEKRDHTINQERLTENIRDYLEKEYADKEQNYVRQLKQELRAKTSTIRDQCKMSLIKNLKN